MIPTPNITWRTQPQGERLFVATTCNYLIIKFKKIQLNQQETTFFFLVARWLLSYMLRYLG